AALGKMLDRITAIAQDALVPVDVADGAPARGRIEESRIVRHEPGIVGRRLDLSQVDRANRAVLDGDLVLFGGAVVDDGKGVLGHARHPGNWLAKDNKRRR